MSRGTAACGGTWDMHKGEILPGPISPTSISLPFIAYFGWILAYDLREFICVTDPPVLP